MAWRGAEPVSESHQDDPILSNFNTSSDWMEGEEGGEVGGGEETLRKVDSMERGRVGVAGEARRERREINISIFKG